MLFTKKQKFSVNEGHIKEDMLSPDGTVVLKINLRYPEISCPKRDKLRINALPLYAKLSQGFAQYAKSELYKAALEKHAKMPEGFIPFSAVMRWEKTFEDDKYISFMIDVSVCDGETPPSFDRKTQIWEREQGTKCRSSHFFASKDAIIIDDADKKMFDKELFVLRDDSFEFFIRQESGYKSLFLPRK